MNSVHGGDIYTDGIFKGKMLLDFSSNINPLGVPKSFRDNIDEALDNVTRYPDIKYRQLKGYIVDYIKSSEAIIDESCIVLGNGASEIIDLALKGLGSILITAPSFAEYESSAVKWGVNIKYSYLIEDMSYDYDDIMDKLKDVGGIIIGNPNNPNGDIIDKNKFQNILEYCELNNKIIIIDEAFIEFTSDKNHSFMYELNKYSCLFIIRAITKFFAMPGIRFGYGISRNKLIVDKIKSLQNPWNINCFAETAVKYVLSDKQYINETLAWIEAERKYILSEFNKVKFIERAYNTHSAYVLCRLKNITCHELYDLCLKEGILIRKADNFNGLGSSFVRFAIKDRASNVKLINALNCFCE